MAAAARHAETQLASGEAIRVRGLVQGVGFRPTVWRLAHECGLTGAVYNDSAGVLIEVWGSRAARGRFLRRLRRETPPLARIDALESTPLGRPAPAGRFRIVASRAGAVHTAVVPDAATCDECLAEVFAPGDRRRGYAFTNCTHCGPRLSIVRRIPYDRDNTSMAGFAMCPRCRAEYADPADRRFHAQPNACPDCGPRLRLEAAGTGPVELGGDPVEATARLLRDGRIVAIKGIGGFHLACDAADAAAVARLRRRKHRYDKPFALMGRDLEMIRRYCRVTAAEAKLLGAAAAPIVLLGAAGPERLAEGVAPKQRCYGFMLPYSPLHHLLMAELDAPIVLTSGNRSEEPQCIDNREAGDRLSDIADALLLHDRDIVNRLDDSVMRLIAGRPAMLRRGRGYAPAPLSLPDGFAAAPPTLAFGGELKSTFCLVEDGEAVLSQHLGDLENAAVHASFQETLDRYLQLFEHAPRVLAIDRHPDYLSAKLGREWAAAGATLVTVQHHHAHVAACLIDNAIERDAAPVLGVALDGIGYGDDGTLWGGEFLLAGYRGCRRLASLAPVAMPGAAQAVRQPWRMAFAHLHRALGETDPGAVAALSAFDENDTLVTLARMLESGFNSPLTSSCGRLFDAVAAVLGICTTAGYEGQAAIELEAAVERDALGDRGYAFAIEDDGLPRLEPRPMWQALLADRRRGVANGVIAARFHAGLARAIVAMIRHLEARHGDRWGGRVALSGGVFQNVVLSEALTERLEESGFEVLRHRRVPANDGGLSLGQAAVAAARVLAERAPCA